MDLLNENTRKKEPPKSKKIILVLLIISVIALLLIIGVIIFLKMQPEKAKEFGISVNDTDIKLVDSLLVEDADGVQYIALKDIANSISYNYYNGGYLEYTEDINKCYLGNSDQIVGFEADSNEIYKTTENANVDYQHYKLNNNVVMYENKLYISLDDIRRST